ncbi:MAG: cob(I)yrinic acid a,c-diamide adenosyltransferase [Bacteroidales bacterium]|nr:cob(I)yrinic acid a,c-diamide adenosyltransferase [Bacteroidales bacterium]
MKIYTKTGDNGTTSLVDGSRVYKDDNLLEAYGTIDELNAHIGVVIAQKSEDFLTKVQNMLFVTGSLLATPTDKWETFFKDVHLEDFTKELEGEIDRMQAELPKMKGFILPQGNLLIANLHVCRTVCRRAERNIVKLMREDERYKPVQKMINRLSDYLFILARFTHKEMGIDEIVWQSIK